MDAEGYPVLTGPGLAMMEGAKAGGVVVFLTAKAQALSAVVELLSREFRLPISDQTGLEGRFDFKLAFAPRPPGALPPAAVDDAGAPEVAPNLTTAIQQQLGLRLSARKIPTEVLVIDRVDSAPTEN